jgi:hypothetical protein
MSKLAKLIKELSPDAIRWAESVAAKLSGNPEDMVRFPTTPEQVIYATGEKLANLERLAPQMLDIYDDRALYNALDEAQEGRIDVGLMDPDTFRKAAAEIDTQDPYIRDMVADKVQNLQDLRQSGIRFSDVPFLGYKEPYPGIAQIFSHEGRHRSRALAGQGEPLQLVRMRPYRGSKTVRRGGETVVVGEDTAPLMTQMDPSTQVYSEVSTMQQDSGGKPIGALGELIKFLGLGGVAAPGVLSQVGSQQDG